MVVPTSGRRGRALDLTKGYKGSVSWMEWCAPNQLLFASDESTSAVLGTLTVDPERRREPVRRTLWSGRYAMQPGYWQRFTLSPSTGTIATSMEGHTEPPEAWAGKLAADRSSISLASISSVNGDLADLALGEIRRVEWRSSDGLKVPGLFAVPPEGLRKGRGKLPLVVVVHGGPTLAFRYTYYLHNYSQPIHLLASKGFAVLAPNPRGSTGRGLRYAEGNVRGMGAGDFQDIMAGVDWCIETGLVDPKRVYIMGHSYGGFMAAWAVTQTKKFRAAVMMAGISDWLSFHGTSDIPLWDSNHYRSDPYRSGNLQSKFSPINFVRNVSTPTLIVVGAEDPSAPPTQSYEFFRALRDLGVETELFVYPREGHGFKEEAHITHVTERILDWITKH